MINIFFCEDEEEIEFAATGTGSQGEGRKYNFVLEFFLPVDKDSGNLGQKEPCEMSKIGRSLHINLTVELGININI